ncbi:predicted protein [Chaetomium globosum CBS 148.51]|uniref:Uncharacterized protein n=1 Tax=Chaetomium globosum (strain ATCC 6205 / CBS 148.51 / DSM 1962 / NBRC 6347 / NRRL 1970) TaxID=306901 RepID=Q2GYT2_CHAGB|nr:uncharacterized protein CHGG_06872 [Chaetomium globosum CBS 148.51]EAQ85619.1 predicted protein [Chaetomium globosum CBS 148.51]
MEKGIGDIILANQEDTTAIRMTRAGGREEYEVRDPTKSFVENENKWIMICIISGELRRAIPREDNRLVLEATPRRMRETARADPKVLQSWAGKARLHDRMRDAEVAGSSKSAMSATIALGPSSGPFSPPRHRELPSNHPFSIGGNRRLTQKPSPYNANEKSAEFYVRTPQESDLPLQCAQEILSLFLLSVASKVQSVGGKTWRAAGSDPSEEKDSEPRTWLNSTFEKLARGVEMAGLAPQHYGGLHTRHPGF